METQVELVRLECLDMYGASMSIVEIIIALNGAILVWLGYHETRLHNMSTELKERIQLQADIATHDKNQLNDNIKRVEAKIDTLTMMLVELQLKGMQDGSAKKNQ